MTDKKSTPTGFFCKPAKPTACWLPANKIFLVFYLFLHVFTYVKGQTGVTYRYQWVEQGTWAEILEPFYTEPAETKTFTFLDEGHSIRLHYGFRLPSIRIELLPSVGYETSKKTFDSKTGTVLSDRFSLQAFSLSLDVLVFPFDLAGDCDCPVFSKSDPLFKKGFFVQAGVSWSHFQFDQWQSETQIQSTTAAPGYFVGCGLDLGVSERLTISPHVGKMVYPGLMWNNLEPPTGSGGERGNTRGDFSTLQAGLRVQYHFRS